MDIFITLDYELYMGKRTGSVENCLLKPVEELLALGLKHKIKFTFFVDAAYLYRLSLLRKDYPTLDCDYRKVCNNIKSIEQQGHDIQLHFHPQWLFSEYDGREWIMNMHYYKISDVEPEYLRIAFSKSKALLESIISKEIIAFRAGGYSLQTFTDYCSLFVENNIKLDSSVLMNSSCKSEFQEYDYSGILDDSIYRFNDDVCKLSKKGIFTEAAIATKTVSFLSYLVYRLFVKIRYRNNDSFGDGLSVVSSRRRKVKLSKQVKASIDHFEVYFLKRFIRRNGNLVVIGHPKNLSVDSIHYLDCIFSKMIGVHRFKTLSELL